MSAYRNGREISDTEIQVAADKVAKDAINAFVNGSGPPDLKTPGDLDGGAATVKEFDGDLSAWSGNMLLVLMGESFFLTPICARRMAIHTHCWRLSAQPIKQALRHLGGRLDLTA